MPEPRIGISCTTVDGLSITVDGKPARLAVVTEEGKIIDSGVEVADAVESASVDAFKNFLAGKGHLRELNVSGGQKPARETSTHE
jgi:hypothetical protein